MQRETYIRGDKNKEKIKQADFPAEAPESSSDKYETGNAEHSLHDLFSEFPKEYSLTGIGESCDRAKNDSGANQAEKHSAHDVFQKTPSWFLARGQPENRARRKHAFQACSTVTAERSSRKTAVLKQCSQRGKYGKSGESLPPGMLSTLSFPNSLVFRGSNENYTKKFLLTGRSNDRPAGLGMTIPFS